MSIPTTKYSMKIQDMSEDVHADAQKVILIHFQIILKAFEDYREERQIANYIRETFDKQHEESWNVIVGKDFGAHVVHATSCYLFARYGELYVLLWKAA